MLNRARSTVVLAVVLGLALVVSGCGSDDEPKDVKSAKPSSSVTTEAPAPYLTVPEGVTLTEPGTYFIKLDNDTLPDDGEKKTLVRGNFTFQPLLPEVAAAVQVARDFPRDETQAYQRMQQSFPSERPGIDDLFVLGRRLGLELLEVTGKYTLHFIFLQLQIVANG